MDLTKEAIEKIVSLGGPNFHELAGLTFTDKPMSVVREPAYDVFVLTTLQGVVELSQLFLRAGLSLVAVVNSHAQVIIRTRDYNAYNASPILINAAPAELDGFPFGRFLPHEEFCLGLLTRFAQDEPVKNLFRLVSHVTDSGALTAEDDGISQKATVMTGVATRAGVTVQPIWTLRPFRTFPEIEQPSSPFLFRMKSAKDQPPHCGLFEADGGLWRVTAHRAIADYLRQQFSDGIPVVA